MELADIQTFLVMCEELHFGRAGERLRISGSRVGQRIRRIEQEFDVTLFERTTRAVHLTELGRRLRNELTPACEHLTQAVHRFRTVVEGAETTLRLGFTLSTGGPAVDRLIAGLRESGTCSTVSTTEVPVDAPYESLRAGDTDIVVNWIAAPIDDLCYGPAIGSAARALMVGVAHPLASRARVTTDDLVEHAIPWFEPVNPLDAPLRDVLLPPTSNGGKAIPRGTRRVRTLAEAVAQVRGGEVVWPTIFGLDRYSERDGVTFVPIEDLPNLPFGPIWHRSRPPVHLTALHRAATQAARLAG